MSWAFNPPYSLYAQLCAEDEWKMIGMHGDAS